MHAEVCFLFIGKLQEAHILFERGRKRRQEQRRELALRMLQKGKDKYTIAEISELTGLMEDEIKALREEND